MNYLVYCVFRARDGVSDSLPPGVEGAKVSLVVVDGLAASFSRVCTGGPVPSVPRVQAYAQVVEALHKRCTVLPMRYGCEFSTRAQIVQLLCERRAEFQAALDEVEGCVEMSVRVLLGKTGRPAPKNGVPAPGPFPGKVYLAARKAWYAERDEERSDSAAVARRIENTFERLFVGCLVEAPCVSRERLLTLHFLMDRRNQGRFRQAFRRLEKSAPEKLLLTGPWPPYNFTSCQRATLALDPKSRPCR
jgi:hypothetical protein